MGHDAAADGYVKSILATTQSLLQTLRAYGDLIPTDDSSSATTFYTDYHATAHELNTIYGARFGGSADDDALSGLAYLHSYSSPADARVSLGSRLVWQK